MATQSWTFRMDPAAEWPDNQAKGFGETIEQAKADLEHDFPGQVYEVLSGPEPLPEVKTDFGPNGPQPGTAAYSAFVMAQLFPTNEEEGIYDGFWDDWKEDIKNGY